MSRPRKKLRYPTTETKICVGEYELSDEELDEETIGDAMERHGTDFVMVGAVRCEPTTKDRGLTIREFMEAYEIDVAVVREVGTMRRCVSCGETSVPFTNPLAMQCRECHRESCRKWRRKKKESVEGEIARLSRELERVMKVLVENGLCVDDDF